MGQDESQVGQGVDEESENRGPEEIREDIEATRGEMGETVEALAEKADVKAQAQQRIEGLKQTALAKKQELVGKAKQASPESASGGAHTVTTKAKENPLPLAVGGALFVGFLLGRRGR